jgi:hypothetical protein
VYVAPDVERLLTPDSVEAWRSVVINGNLRYAYLGSNTNSIPEQLRSIASQKKSRDRQFVIHYIRYILHIVHYIDKAILLQRNNHADHISEENVLPYSDQ